MSVLKYLEEALIKEMIVIGGIKPLDDKYVLAFDKWVWVFDEKDPKRFDYMKDIVDKLNLDDKKKNRLTKDEPDIYDFITNIQEDVGDILAGQVQKKNLYLYDYGSFKQDPKSSILVKKVVSQLGLNSASYMEDIDGNETKISKNKMKAEIPDIAFHGTSSRFLHSIMSKGLRANEEDSNYASVDVYHPDLIFFATRIGEALHHATHTSEVKGGIPIILEFQIPDKDQIIGDYDVEIQTGKETNYSHVQKSSQTSYKKDPFKLSKEYGVYGYKSNIKPIFIKYVYISTKGTEETNNIKDFKKMKPTAALKYIEMMDY
jgi:hypothetical protein